MRRLSKESKERLRALAKTEIERAIIIARDLGMTVEEIRAFVVECTDYA